MISNIDSFVKLYKSNLPAKQAALALQDRIRGWEEFEKAIHGVSPDIPFLMSWVKKLTSENITFGVFLNHLLSGHSSAAIKESAIPGDVSCLPSWSSASLATLPEFLAFLKVFIGISSALVVFSWAVDLNARDCVQKALSIICLWQTIPSYQEVILLCQFPIVIYFYPLSSDHRPRPCTSSGSLPFRGCSTTAVGYS